MANAMKSQQKVAERLINLIDVGLRNRPEMFLGTNDPEIISAFLEGIVFGVEACGYSIPVTFGGRYGLLYRERGWDETKHLIPQMRERGMDNAAIFNEIIEDRKSTRLNSSH